MAPNLKHSRKKDKGRVSSSNVMKLVIGRAEIVPNGWKSIILANGDPNKKR